LNEFLKQRSLPKGPIDYSRPRPILVAMQIKPIRSESRVLILIIALIRKFLKDSVGSYFLLYDFR